MNLRFAAPAALLIGALALSGCTAGANSMPGMDHGTSASASPEASVLANDADAMFATMMIVHHEQAIEMSDLVLGKDGIDERVVALAERIKAAQAPEIERLQGWVDDWGVASGHETMDHGDGMMSDDDMTALEQSAGAAASGLFLEQMIVHHEGAIEMAQAEVDGGENPDATALAQAIIDAQQAEVDEMKALLAEL